MANELTTANTTHVHTATAADLLLIRNLQNKHREELGWIPPAATQREIEWGHVLTGQINEDNVGFLLVQPTLGGQHTTAAIIQACVRMDARRRAVGLDLVKAVARKAAAAGSTILQCWCRQDLESNLFWDELGFQAISKRRGGQARGIPHILWRKPLNRDADVFELPTDRTARGAGGIPLHRTQTQPQLPLWPLEPIPRVRPALPPGAGVGAPTSDSAAR